MFSYNFVFLLGIFGNFITIFPFFGEFLVKRLFWGEINEDILGKLILAQSLVKKLPFPCPVSSGLEGAGEERCGEEVG